MNPTAPTRPHRRYNPLRRQWVLVSPQRTSRPWQGQTTKPAAAERVHYDPACYLCPGNPRAGGPKLGPDQAVGKCYAAALRIADQDDEVVPNRLCRIG